VSRYSSPKPGPRATRLLTAAGLLAIAAVMVALFTQHKMGMQPCPWCVLQRLQLVVIAALALTGAASAAMRFQLLARATAALVALLAASGVAAALWQHFVAASADSCKMSLADQIINDLALNELLPSVFAATASCADKGQLLGLPYEWYSLAVFVAVGAAALMALRRRR
jgi:protein dithiol:quinone oxidoreductase